MKVFLLISGIHIMQDMTIVTEHSEQSATNGHPPVILFLDHQGIYML